MHDYTAQHGVEACFILAPPDAPSWAQDRAALWNAAEALSLGDVIRAEELDREP